jgi:hypothetical protein
MTKAEFLSGWKLLVLQPWGWRYNQCDKAGRPTADSLAQLDLYFSSLEWAHSDAWQKAVRLYVQGKDWPALGELLATLKQINPQFVRGLPDRSVDRRWRRSWRA